MTDPVTLAAPGAPLQDALKRLQAAWDAEGRRLDVLPLPMPPPIVEAGARCPASYANFYLANGVALVPTFGAPSDDVALAVLSDVWSGETSFPFRPAIWSAASEPSLVSPSRCRRRLATPQSPLSKRPVIRYQTALLSILEKARSRQRTTAEWSRSRDTTSSS